MASTNLVDQERELLEEECVADVEGTTDAEMSTVIRYHPQTLSVQGHLQVSEEINPSRRGCEDSILMRQ